MLCFVCQSDSIVNCYFRQEFNSKIFYFDQRCMQYFFTVGQCSGKIFFGMKYCAFHLKLYVSSSKYNVL